MSEQGKDEFREWLENAKSYANTMRLAADTDPADVPYHKGEYMAFCAALAHYDATAPQRARAERAMEFIRQASQKAMVVNIAQNADCDDDEWDRRQQAWADVCLECSTPCDREDELGWCQAIDLAAHRAGILPPARREEGAK